MKRLTVCLLILLILCGCENSGKTDIIKFCNDFNEFSQNIKISESSLIKESENGDYIISLKNGKSEILLRLKSNADSELTSYIVTGENADDVLEVGKISAICIGEELPGKFLKSAKNTEKKLLSETEKRKLVWLSSDGYFTLSSHEYQPLRS